MQPQARLAQPSLRPRRLTPVLSWLAIRSRQWGCDDAGQTAGRLLFPIAFVLAAIGFAGCDGCNETATRWSSPDDVTKAYLLAIADDNGAAACRHASEGLIDQIAPDGDCEQAIETAITEATDEDRAQIDGATYTVVNETDTDASVTVTREDGATETFDLVQADGEWKLTN